MKAVSVFKVELEITGGHMVSVKQVSDQMAVVIDDLHKVRIFSTVEVKSITKK